MKITYDIISKNIETYKEAKDIFPVITQFEQNDIDYSAMHSLGLNKFADFHMFIKYLKLHGFEPITDTKSFKVLKPIIVDKTTTERFKTFNSPNGWGMYDNFVPFVAKYLEACVAYPDAIIDVNK